VAVVELPETEHELAPVPHLTQVPLEDNPNPDKQVRAVVLLEQVAAPAPQPLQVLFAKY